MPKKKQGIKWQGQLFKLFGSADDGLEDDVELQVEDLHGPSISDQDIAREHQMDGLAREDFALSLLEGIDDDKMGAEEVQSLVSSILNPSAKKENSWWKDKGQPELDLTGVIDLGSISLDSCDEF